MIPEKLPLRHVAGAVPPVIAVVDDDASFLRSIGRLLRTAGYHVETFSSARKFLESTAVRLPQCLVLDVHMPEMTGLELQSRLRALGHQIPILFITAQDSPQMHQLAAQSGSLGVLLKPFDVLALMTAIGNAVEQSPL